MKAAQDVLDKPEATQKEVDDALTALTEAKENLKTKEPSVEKPGKAELEETVNDAKAFDWRIRKSGNVYGRVSECP